MRRLSQRMVTASGRSLARSASGSPACVGRQVVATDRQAAPALAARLPRVPLRWARSGEGRGGPAPSRLPIAADGGGARGRAGPDRVRPMAVALEERAGRDLGLRAFEAEAAAAAPRELVLVLLFARGVLVVAKVVGGPLKPCPLMAARRSLRSRHSAWEDSPPGGGDDGVSGGGGVGGPRKGCPRKSRRRGSAPRRSAGPSREHGARGVRVEMVGAG